MHIASPRNISVLSIDIKNSLIAYAPNERMQLSSPSYIVEILCKTIFEIHQRFVLSALIMLQNSYIERQKRIDIGAYFGVILKYLN